jgi:ATP-dependent Lon protease
MFFMLGPPGVGKTHIAEAIAGATGLPIETISMNGKKDTSVFFGVPQEYAGAGPGEIIKGMVRHKSATMIFVFDEIDKCAKDVQQVLGNITDRKLNKKFKDVFLDYPIPIRQLIVFTTGNYPENVDEFLKQRMTSVKISANTYQERIEIAKDLLSYEFKKYKVSSLRDKVSDSLIKKMLT